MYEQAYMSIGKGLRLVFFGEILTTVAGLFSWFGLSLIGLVLTIVGLGMARQGDSGYQKAFHVTILHLAMVFLGVILTAFSSFHPVFFVIHLMCRRKGLPGPPKQQTIRQRRPFPLGGKLSFVR